MARAVMKQPEVKGGYNDAGVKDILDAYKKKYENIHDYHEMLNNIITSVTIKVINGHGWLINTIFGMGSQSHRYKHTSTDLSGKLALTELFAVKIRSSPLVT